jgi:hypothetical protein
LGKAELLYGKRGQQALLFLQNGVYVEQIDTDMVIETRQLVPYSAGGRYDGAFQGVICRTAHWNRPRISVVAADNTENENRVDHPGRRIWDSAGRRR